MKDRARILLVDDRPDKHVVYRAILDDLGQQLVTAMSGEQALKEVLKTDFAVILLDVNMPGMDGFETAELIRRRKRSAHVPIIFVTADYGDDVRFDQGILARSRRLHGFPDRPGDTADESQGIRRPVPACATGEAPGKRERCVGR